MATPYVISSDLVSAYPAKSLEIAQYIDGFKADLALVQNAQTGTTYTFVAADFTKLVTLANASPVAVTLPLESSVAWPAGTQLRLLNLGAGTVTVAGDVGVTINGTPLTLAQYKGAVIVKTATNAWVFVPFVSGSAGATVSGTTGSPTTGTGKDGKALYTWTANGSVTFSAAGIVRVVAVSGGKGGSGVIGNAGSGGEIQDYSFIVEATTYTVTIGAGGAYQGNGGASSFVLTNKLSVRPNAATTNDTGNANKNTNATGLLTDISDSSVGYGGAGYSTTNSATYDSTYGGAQQTLTLARANSGGGGNEVGAGTGAAGIVQLLV
jgi:hypothetical protein